MRIGPLASMNPRPNTSSLIAMYCVWRVWFYEFIFIYIVYIDVPGVCGVREFSYITGQCDSIAGIQYNPDPCAMVLVHYTGRQ